METLFMVLSLNVQRGASEEIFALWGFFTVVSLLLADLHLIRCPSFVGVENVRSGRKFGAKIVEIIIKVVEINAPL